MNNSPSCFALIYLSGQGTDTVLMGLKVGNCSIGSTEECVRTAALPPGLDLERQGFR